MKKIVIAVCTVLSFFTVAAQTTRYEKAMQANVSGMDTAFKNPNSLLALANSFERIALAEKKEWLPYYYAALLQVNYGFMAGDMSALDPIADKAENLLNKADSLQPNNSEISVVKAMIATARMVVNPMQRYMQYGALIEKNIEAAKAQDETNPRPYYLKGENLKNTPEQFGGGCTAALQELEKALTKFAAFKPQTALHPNWGLQRTEFLIKGCK